MARFAWCAELRLGIEVFTLALFFCLQVTGQEFAPAITPPPQANAVPVVKRDDLDLTNRPDFFAWTSGYDNTWTPTFCYGSLSTIGSAVGCCSATSSCDFGLGCLSGSLIQTKIEPGTRSRTETTPCNGGPLGQSCNTGTFFQNFGDTSALSFFRCAYTGIPGQQAPRSTWYRTLSANAPVFITTPSDVFTAPASTRTSSGGINSRTSSTGSRSPGSSSTSTNNGSESSSVPGSSPSQSNEPNSSGSGGLSNSEKIGIGIGVGLGVPLVVLAALAWLCPAPLQRWRRRAAPTTASTPVASEAQKSELPSHTQTPVYPPNTQWAPQQVHDQYYQYQQPGMQPSNPPPGELHDQSRAELPGHQKTPW